MTSSVSKFNYPKYLRRLFDQISAVSNEKFEKLVTYIEEVLFQQKTGVASLRESDKKVSNELGLNQSVVTAVGAAYTALVNIFVRENSESNFLLNLTEFGLEQDKGKIFWGSMSNNKDKIADVFPGNYFNPLPQLTDLVWRINLTKANSGQISLRKPTGLINLELDDAEGERYETFEVNITSLGYLIDELLRMQKEFTNIIENEEL